MKNYLLISFFASVAITFVLFLICDSQHTAKSQDLTVSENVIPRDIYLRGEINSETAFFIQKQLEIMNDAGTGEITMHITSPGGEVYAGLQIYDYMKQSKSKIRTSCEGMCMSMAAFILTWGNVRQADEHSTIMFHQV